MAVAAKTGYSSAEVVPSALDPALAPAPGDFILVRRRGFVPSAIRVGQFIRFRDRRYTEWNHAALVVSSNGDLVEALTCGVVRSHLSDYRGEEYVLVRVNASLADQAQVVRFADSVVGERYGFATDFCIVLSTVPGWSFTFGFQAHEICSGVVARAEERVGAVFPRLAQDITPADLALYYDVPRKIGR